MDIQIFSQPFCISFCSGLTDDYGFDLDFQMLNHYLVSRVGGIIFLCFDHDLAVFCHKASVNRLKDGFRLVSP